MKRAELIIRFLLGVIVGLGGLSAGLLVGNQREISSVLPWGLALGLAGLFLGFFLVPYVSYYPFRALLRQFQKLPTPTIVVTVAGLVIGLVVGVLLFLPLAQIPGIAGVVLPLVVSLFWGALGAAVAASRQNDILRRLPTSNLPNYQQNGAQGPILLDTSAIIDGRIADLATTGFLRGTLTVPVFILDELRHIADSTDPMRRTRGRRGMEILHRLRDETNVQVQVLEVPAKNGLDVDASLVKLAKEMKAPIFTTDYNLNRLADFQGVQVLNINELANALKPVFLPGEELSVHVVQEGKEPGQGVGFLEDGTMVVVDAGKRYVNATVDVVVTRVLQTAAGRIVFAHPKGLS